MSARIVVVEDDIISQDIVRSALQAKGFIVDVASDGFSAVQLLNKGGYDLALIDYQLPDMDGYASARVLRNMAEAGGPKLIACTANTTELRGCGASAGLPAARPPKSFPSQRRNRRSPSACASRSSIGARPISFLSPT